jgi:hypothetical protein
MSECGADYKPDVPDISIYNLASHISGIDVFYLGVPAKRLYLLDTRLRHTAARGRQHVFGDAQVMFLSVSLQPPSRLHLLISPRAEGGNFPRRPALLLPALLLPVPPACPHAYLVC